MGGQIEQFVLQITNEALMLEQIEEGRKIRDRMKDELVTYTGETFKPGVVGPGTFIDFLATCAVKHGE
ncbi:MAG: hypothetical protein OSB21_03485, partial [Myxococcota bacterium]|nr:hypothetical protein [Myxococcota bacterium]